jgi:transcriptional regulator with XRE-family HTH domain
MDDEHIRISFGQQVRHLRRSRGWSQEELAARVGLDRTYIGSVERGERNPGLINIVRLARAMDVPVKQLFINISEGE